MGGHALDKVKTRRYNTDEFISLALKMRVHMLNIFERGIHIVRAYHSKQDHGDMDILLQNDGTLGNIAQKLQDYFKPGQMKCNGGVYSFDYEEFQIDVILCNPEDWDTSIAFFDYDPSGNLMGKIAHKFGLKYGFKGLVYPYRTIDGVEFGDIVISKDNRKVFGFLGFDYDRFLAGFNTKQEIFDYVVDSKYFDPQNFLMENLNHIDKKRNKKRPTYQEFLSYINAEVESGRKWNQTFAKNKEEYVPLIDLAFPEANLYDEIERYKELDRRRLVVHQKFNGDMLNSKYGIGGEELGAFITGFKKHIVDLQRAIGLEGQDKQLFNDYLYNCSQDIINADIDKYREEHFKPERNG